MCYEQMAYNVWFGKFMKFAPILASQECLLWSLVRSSHQAMLVTSVFLKHVSGSWQRFVQGELYIAIYEPFLRHLSCQLSGLVFDFHRKMKFQSEICHIILFHVFKGIINKVTFLCFFFSDVEMLQSKPDTPTARDEISLNTKDSMLRKFLEGETYLEREENSTVELEVSP